MQSSCKLTSVAASRPPTHRAARRWQIEDLAGGVKGPFVLCGWKGLSCCSEHAQRRGFVPLIDNEYQKGHIYIMSWVGIACAPTAGKKLTKINGIRLCVPAAAGAVQRVQNLGTLRDGKWQK